MMENNGYSLADIATATGNGNNNGFGDGAWWIVLFLIFGAFGWNNGGFGGNGGATSGYVLQSDFATLQRMIGDGNNMIERKLDAQNNGICDLGYTSLSLNNQTNMAMMNGFNQTQAQIANSGNSITSAIKDCCCDTEKQFMQTRFDAAQYNCNTLQAIDKVGDRIIDYLANDKTQALRDENNALRLAASQAAQNQYLINQLRPAPVPAFNVPSPFYYGHENGCGCC